MQELSELFKRYLNNQCTPEEIRTLLDYFNVEGDNVHLKLMIQEQLNAEVAEDFEKQPEVIKAFLKTDAYFEDKVHRIGVKNRVFSNAALKYGIAASIACILIASIFYKQIKHTDSIRQNLTVNDVKPGTDKAILTLSDGSSIALDNHSDSTLLKKAGIKITTTKDGLLVYQAEGKQEASAEVRYNQINTPKGGQYYVLLSDGTKVKLNASSSLRYPLIFTGNARKVELTGEAYFEVEKVEENGVRKTFSVETPTQVVEVLGTHFNIMAYADDAVVKTTLVSGKVNVYSRTGLDNKILNPGEQAILNTGSSVIQVNKVNVESAIAWKNGNFMFEDLYLKDILKQLSRWYDVSVDLDKVPETRYNIFISRSETLSSVLKMLEKTGNIKFSILNNTIKINR